MTASAWIACLKWAVAFAVFLLMAPLALGADLSRDEYVARVEPICKANTQANERILKGVRASVKSGAYDKAAAQFNRAAAALEKTLGQIEAVPQPSADEATLGKWLKYVGTEADLLRKAGSALKAHNKVQAQAQVVRLTHNANVANVLVAGFDFTNCKFDPTKFS
jgi:hypothetical protein